MAELATRDSSACAVAMFKRSDLAPGAARAFVRQALKLRDVADDVISDACLVTSELVTNAVKHVPMAEEIWVCVSINQGRPLLEVWDPSPVLPVVVEDPANELESGRGLKYVVAELSTSWFCRTCPQDKGAGKIVGAFI